MEVARAERGMLCQHLRVPLIANGDVKQLQDVYDIFSSCASPVTRLRWPNSSSAAPEQTGPWRLVVCSLTLRCSAGAIRRRRSV
eukprot:764923-Hanusia_phi.AAC.8